MSTIHYTFTSRGAPSVMAQLCAIADARPEPLVHPDDLNKHDRRAIEANPGDAFAWAIYEHGTHMVWAGPDRAYARYLARCMQNTFPRLEWHWCDGKTVSTPETYEQIMRRLNHNGS